MTNECPYCGTSRVLYDWRLECCRVRYVSGLPKPKRQAYYRDMERQKGREAVLRFIEAVKAAWRRNEEAGRNY